MTEASDFAAIGGSPAVERRQALDQGGVFFAAFAVLLLIVIVRDLAGAVLVLAQGADRQGPNHFADHRGSFTVDFCAVNDTLRSNLLFAPRFRESGDVAGGYMLPMHNPDSLSAAQLRDFFEHTADLVQSVDAEGRVLFVNRAWREALGYGVEDSAALNLLDVVHPDHRERCREIRRSLSPEQRVVQIESALQARDGRRIEIEGRVTAQFEHDRLVSMLGIFRNVTEQREVEWLLRETEERLGALTNAATEAIIFHQQGVIIEVNPAAYHTFGYRLGELIGRPVMELVPQTLREQARRYAQNTEELHYEFIGLRRSGETFPIEVIARNTTYRGQPARLVCVRDFSKRKRIEEALAISNNLLRGLGDVQNRFLAEPGGNAAFESLLALLLSAARSPHGFLGHLEKPPEAPQSWNQLAATDAPWLPVTPPDADAATPEQPTFQNLIALTFRETRPLVINPSAAGPGAADRPVSFLGIPVLHEGELVGVLAVAGRPEGYDAAALEELAPVLATFAGLVLGRRNHERRREVEDDLLRLNEELEEIVIQRTHTLRRSEQRLQQFISTLPGAVYEFVQTPDGRQSIPFISHGARDLFGLQPGEIQGDMGTLFNLVRPEILPTLAESIRDSAETLSTWQMDIPFRTPDGEHKWVRGRAAPRREAGGLVVWIGVFVDVTEQKLAEAELQRERQILRTLIDSLPDVVYFKDHEARYLVVNEPMARLAGCKSPQNLIGKSPHDLFPKKIADDFAAADREVFESGRKTVSATQELTTPDGPNRYYVTTKVPLRDDQGRVIGLVGVGHDITEHIQADASLRASEASLRRSQALGRIGSWRLDIADDSLTWSDETYRMFGVPAGTALKYGDFIALVHPGDRDAVWNAWRQTRMDGPGEFEYRIVVDAEVFWVREVAEHQFDSAGKLCAIAGTVQDITDRKITSDALEILSTGVAGLVGEQFHNEVARQIARLFGVEIGFVCKRVNDPGHRVRPIGFSIDDQIVQRLEYDLSKTPCEYVMGEDATFCCGLQKRFPENEFIREHIVESYAAVPMFDREGRQIGHLGLMSRKPLLHPERLRTILRLFAVRTAAEMERARAEARFRDLVEFAPDALFLTNRDGVITLINRQAETVFGYTRAELIGQPVEVLMPKKTHVDHVHLRQRYLDTPTPRPMGANRSHLYARRKDGTVFPADISLSPIQSDEGLSVVAAVRDTTDRVRAEEERGKLEGQLRQAQKMDAIGTLAGGIAHDFNNLLTAILGNAELLMMLIEPGHPHLENLEPIRAASLRARDLVKQILTFSRRVEGERLPILVQEIANEAVKLLRSTIPAMVELITDIDPACPLVVADATQVHQVIMNLCTNAWHALPERGGRISLRVEPVEVTGEKAATHPDLRAGPHVRLTVTDNGHGMSKETIERIFEPFFTTKKHGKGTGLGLSVVHGIVDAHQGAILVESTPGEGTTFEVYLPAQKAVTAAALAKKQPLQFGRGEHILMVDDEVSVGKMVEAMLTRLQYRVTRHIHPTEMLAEFQKSPESFDLVITDMAMPEMSGADLAGALIRIRSNIPIILISGMLDRAHEAVARANGVRVILQKPMSQEALSNALHDLLEKEPPPG